MVMKVLDICAGTGSATKAFVDRGHDVDTLDIVGGHTFNMDVRKFKPWKKYDFIWASPPCTCFRLPLLVDIGFLVGFQKKKLWNTLIL